MFLAMAEDVRVVLIKLADRLHNMRTIAGLAAEKQQRIARQTLEIYAPLAERLGIWQIKWELEDLSFKVPRPGALPAISQQPRHAPGAPRELRRARDGRAAAGSLEASGIEADLSGRPKHLYSIHRKMERKSANFDEIYDVYAIRLLVDEIKDCYAALGVVHSLWRPIPGQFDDYIAMPKANGYQSLHTAVMALEGQPLEVQIRTHADALASREVGIAAHWRYKEGSKSDRDYDAKLAWIRQLIDWQREVADATEFVEGIKLDIFQDQVFVFTPKGDVKDLPAGSTPLDFAYRIHTDIGHRCIGAKVNNRLVPLDYRLKNGDIVEIVTTKAEHGPSRDWLSIVRTSHAREKIRQWFKQPGARREHRARARVAGPGAESPRRGPRSRAGRRGPAARDGASPTSTRRWRTSMPPSGTARSPQQVVIRMGVVDDSNELALPPVAPPMLPRRRAASA